MPDRRRVRQRALRLRTSAAGGGRADRRHRRFLLYLRQEGRGIGLYAKLDAYALQDAGLDTYEANRALGRGEDERDYTAAAQMLLALGVPELALLSNNPDKARSLAALGVRVVEQVPTAVHLRPSNGRYLQAKRDRTAHTLDLPYVPAPRPVPQAPGTSSDEAGAVSSRAEVPTDVPARYAEQLVAHLGRRALFTCAGESYRAELACGTGVVVVGDGVLTLLAQAPDPRSLAVVQDVLGRHLERFGRRDELSVAWTAAA